MGLILALNLFLCSLFEWCKMYAIKCWVKLWNLRRLRKSRRRKKRRRRRKMRGEEETRSVERSASFYRAKQTFGGLLCPLVLQIQLGWKQVERGTMTKIMCWEVGCWRLQQRKEFEHFRPNYVRCIATFLRYFDETKCLNQFWDDWDTHEEHGMQRAVWYQLLICCRTERKYEKWALKALT